MAIAIDTVTGISTGTDTNRNTDTTTNTDKDFYCPPFHYGTLQCNTPCLCKVENSVSCDSVTGACVCRSGWTGAKCDVDIDECLTGTHSCVETEKCTNIPGSFTCSPDCDTTLSPILVNQQQVKIDSGVIKTHKYNTYPLYRAQCNWFITGDQGDVITFHVEDGNFQLVERAYCYEDTLNIFDGGLGTDQQIGQYCGTKIPRLIRTETNAMILQLRTAYGYHTGFTGNYYIHPCRPFTWGKKCEYDCGCKQVNTEFCDSTKGICVCKPGYTGTYCDNDVDECLSVKCKDNAVCTNTLGSYSCACREGYKENSLGICEIIITTCTSAITCIPNKKECFTLNGRESCLCPEGTIDVARTGNIHYCSIPLYPYGNTASDSKKSRGTFGTVTYNEAVPFGTTSVNNAYIHLEGVISLDNSDKNADGVFLIKPFKTSISEEGCDIYYHLYEKCEPSVFSEASSISSPEKQTVMNRAKKDIIREAKLTDFDVKTVLVVTWENVKYARNAAKRNTFQAIFVSGFAKESSGDFSAIETSYVLYIYPNSMVSWCYNTVEVGYFAGSGFEKVIILDPAWFNSGEGAKQIKFFKVSGLPPPIPPPTPSQQCERFVCKNSGLITNEKYQQEIEELYKCPCSLDRLGLQWVIFQERTPDNIYCFSISLVAKRRLLSTNPLNKLCCYKWNRPSNSIDWESYAIRLSESTLINNSPDSGHVVPGEPGWFEGVTESMAAHQLCCNGANSDKLCKRFYKIYPDMECTYDVEFVPAYLLGDPTVVTLDNVTYLMNGWGEYTLMYVQSEQFSLQARTDRLQTSSGLSNGTVFTAFAAKDGFGTHVQVELSDSKTSMQILVKGSNVTDSFYREVRYKYSFDEVEVIRDNSGNKTKVRVSFPCGVSFTVNVGIKNLELEMQVVKTLKNKTKGLLGNFNGKTNDEFTLPNGTILPPNLTESQIFYNFASEYQVTPNNSVFVYKSGKTASDYQHPTFVPVFLDSVNATLLQAATRLCGEGNTACIYDFFITNDAAFALNTGKTLKQSLAKRLLLANSCPNMTIVQNVNYSNKRWIVQDGVINTLRISGTDADNDSLTYMLYENVTGVSINQSGFLFYTPSLLKPVKFGFRLKDSKNCYTPVVNVQTAICPQCRNNGSCNRKEARNVEYFGGQVQILKCDCPPGYTGEYCESELDACLAKPCYKGRTCTDLTAAQQGNSTVGYVCGPCPKGYEELEEYCFDIDECEDNTTCHQNCTNTEGSYICSCNNGYVLNRTDSRSCLAKNCSNRCVMQNTWYCDEAVGVCMCKDGITTADCHKSMDHCVSNPCPSDRKCNSNDLGYECVCLNGLPPVNGTCSDCNRILTEKSGSFMSSNYPNNYPDGETCTWTITSNDNNSIILLNFTDYQVEGCPYDFLEIYDGASYDSDLIAQFCIDGITDVISSSGNALFISFTSDESVNKRGFFASYIVESLCREKKCSHDCKLVSASPRVEQCLCPEWTRLDSTETICIEINACNTTITDNTGLIVSPGYPSKYPVNTTCHWTLPSKPLKVLTISFSDMDIENGVACPYDSLKVYNGSSSSYPLVGSYCGSSLPKSISSSSGLYLDFTSDGLISGRGFKLQYSYGVN
ncbi:mucin-like protein [Physella acuta]|uniref:mucin-like protein n=1 Tax=Physella acuta TaxID=109671 RepID=UPI0027DDE62B|nr:mucin-like protein [Physella acuta]